MKTLHLNLIRIWFDMIHSLIKPEEYREITPYWCAKLLLVKDASGNYVNYPRSWWAKLLWLSSSTINICNLDELIISNIESGSFKFKVHASITFSNGMTPPVPRFEIELKGIKIDTGNPEWGAEPGKNYFVLKLGKIL